MRLETRQFGEVDYDETQLVTFPQGIAGFEEYTRYLLVETEDYLPFLLLLSVEEPEVGFPIVPTSAVWEGYAPAVPDEELKVLEQGVTFFKDLVRICDKYGLDKWAFEVTRHGAAKDPKTTYSILPEHQLTPEQLKEFQSLKLQDLEKLYSGEAAGSGDSLGSYDRKDDGTVDASTAQAPGERVDFRKVRP